MLRPWTPLLAVALIVAARAAFGQSLDMGIPELNQLNPALTGSGIVVAQAEALYGGTNAFEVNPAVVGQPAGKFIYTDLNGSVSTTFNSSDESGHAEAVGGNFYGSSGGVAPGVSEIYNYEADYFVNDIITDGVAIPARIVNQSFVFVTNGNTTEQAQGQQIYDNYAATYNTLFISGVGNGGAVLAPASSYNGIGVAAYGGQSSTGPTYDGRSKPDITAPATETSYSTPYVSGAATLLLQAAEDGDAGSVTDASDARTLKALLLNGATKPPGWTHTDTAPLDPNYGAGIVNVYNSYLNLVAGEYRSSASTSGSAAPVSAGVIVPDQGWNLATITTPLLSGSYTSESDHYLFDLTSSTAPQFTLTSTLTWWRQAGQTDINNLDLYLFDVTTGDAIAVSDSTVDNVQELYVQDLGPGDYDLVVLKDGGQPLSSGGTVVSGSETYALAFNFSPVPEPPASWLLLLALLLIPLRKPARHP
jgi:hypothetical protein